MKRGCLVTGVAGFVGSHLAEALLALDHRVVGVDNFFSGHRENMASFGDHPDFRFHESSVEEPGLLSRLGREYGGLEVCFHLAAIVSVPYSVDHEEETLRVNWDATEALLGEAEAMGLSRFVFAGSAAEYGEDERLPLLEGYVTPETRHLSPYGRAKHLSTQRVAASPIGVALRCFNIYGPRQDPRSPYSGVISRFIDFAVAGQSMVIFGDGLQTRDFIYVGDVVSAYLAAAGLGAFPSPLEPGVYNAGTGVGISILELADTIRDLTGNPSSHRFMPERPGDIRHSLASIAALRDRSAWRPGVALREGLGRTIAHTLSTRRTAGS
jgi:UDP-glucose 4-epimerase